MKKYKILTILALAVLIFSNAHAEIKKFNMVFVPASEKGDENDFVGLVKIINKLTGFETVSYTHLTLPTNREV